MDVHVRICMHVRVNLASHKYKTGIINIPNEDDPLSFPRLALSHPDSLRPSIGLWSWDPKGSKAFGHIWTCVHKHTVSQTYRDRQRHEHG